MMTKAAFVAGMATGYVLGAKAGRERYQEIMALVGRVRQEPMIQQATETVKDKAATATEAVKDKATSVIGGHMPGPFGSQGGSADGNPPYPAAGGSTL